MTMTGPAVLDVVQHFVERWNEIKKRKVRHLSQRCFAFTQHTFSSTAMTREFFNIN